MQVSKIILVARYLEAAAKQVLWTATAKDFLVLGSALPSYIPRPTHCIPYTANIYCRVQYIASYILPPKNCVLYTASYIHCVQ